MTDIVLPETIVSTYSCKICGETGDGNDGRVNWRQDNPEKPWLKHDPKVMPVHGLDLRIGELFGYDRTFNIEDEIRFMVINSEPHPNRDNHGRCYSIYTYKFHSEGNWIQSDDYLIRRDLKISGSRGAILTSELAQEEYDAILLSNNVNRLTEDLPVKHKVELTRGTLE